VAARSRELDACLVEHGVATVSVSGILPVFCSRHLLGTGSGGVGVDFDVEKLGLTISGHITVRLRPSANRNFGRLVDAELGESDRHGWDELFTPIADVEERARGAVSGFAGSLNGRVARRLQPLFGKGGTLTVLGIGLAPGGLRVASAVARRRERPPRRLSRLGGLR
jgi:hypothetical protein